MKYIIGILIGAAIAIPVSTIAVGEWSDWWELDGSNISVKRIYDHENKLVCWLSAGQRGGVSIDCEPSIELGFPLSE